MGARDRRTKDQKRKTKLAQRERRKEQHDVLPYEGEKYRAPEWTPVIFETEVAVYEALVMSDRHLTNTQVERAIINLVRQLRAGTHPTPADDEAFVYQTGTNEEELLARNIRRHWKNLVAQGRPVAADDLVGILRTLLASMQAQASRYGASLGYLHFLERFMKQAGVDVQVRIEKPVAP